VRIDVVTLFPEFLQAVAELGVVGRAVQREQLVLRAWNPRDFARDRHRSVDDRPYGGGPGMVMTVEPLRSAIRAARAAAEDAVPVSLMSPQGRPLDQSVVGQLALRPRLLLVCGRYEGVDERLIELEVDEEFSIGDYVISGGELAAAVVIDAVARLVPGVLGAGDSAEQDSFMDGLLDCPHYSRPECVDGLAVPPVLLSGDHAAIGRWRRKQALGRTWLRRPDLLDDRRLDASDKVLLEEFQRELTINDDDPGDNPG
jgi:tRNA (guanine37-N1)-methyltransferase